MVVVCHATNTLLAHACAEIGYGFFQVEVIGDFPKREAQDFFANVALPRTGRRDIEVSSQAWEAVYEVRAGPRSGSNHSC